MPGPTPSPEATGAAAPLHDPHLAGLPRDRLLDELLRRLCTVLDADVAQFLLLEGDHLRVTASHGIPLERLAGARVPLGRGFTGAIAADCKPATLADTSSLETFGASLDDEGVCSVMGVPLLLHDSVVGVAVVGSRRSRQFTSDDIGLLSAAAERAAWAVENGLLLAAEQEARRSASTVGERFRRLHVIAEELLADLTVDGVVATLVERGLSLIGAFGGALWAYDEDTRLLRLRGLLGYPPEVEQRWADLPVDADAPAAEAARTGIRVVLRSPAERDERYPALRGRATVGEAFLAAPLVVQGRLIGVLGLGFESAHDLDDEGLAFIDAATAQCASALHRALVVEARDRSLEEVRRASERLSVLQRLTAALADLRDPTATVDLIVDEVCNVLGVRRAALCVLDGQAGVMRTVRFVNTDDAVRRAFDTFPYEPGLPVTDALLERRPIILSDPQERLDRYPALAAWATSEQSWVALPLVIGEHPLGVLALALPETAAFTPEDVDFFEALADQCAHALERSRLLEIEARALVRLELLAEAGRIFAAPLDVRLTSEHFCRLLLGRIADAASIHLREPDGSYVLAAAAHADPEQVEVQREVCEHLAESVTAVYDRILDDRMPVLFGELTAEQALAPLDAESRAVIARRTPTSSALFPLVAGGRALGILSVTTVTDGRQRLDGHDLEPLGELAGRLALAIDGARLLRQQTEIAHTLQRSLLPAALPRVPGADVSVRYLPGDEGVDVGGDFYDVIPLPNGRVGLVVGDVMGRGIRAAAFMGQLRAAVRSYCLEGHSPAAILARLDRLVGTLEDGLLVTAFYAEWDAARGVALCACAGHIPPLVRRPGGAPLLLEIDPGVPLGVGTQSYSELELALPVGSLLLAFTDGLVEGPDLPIEEGLQRLVAAVASSPSASAACDDALSALQTVIANRRYDDDTALLALVTTASAAGAEEDGTDGATLDLAADSSSPARARGLVRTQLGRWGLEQHADSAALLVSELVTNAVRHAGTGLRVRITRIGARVRVEVEDRAPDAPALVRDAGQQAEGGRGLFLVDHLASTWGSVSDGVSKTVWFELDA